MPQRRPLLLSLAALLASPLLPRPARAAPIWRIATEYPATAMPGEGMAAFAAAVAALSNGGLL